jgi:hypothetical protein
MAQELAKRSRSNSNGDCLMLDIGSNGGYYSLLGLSAGCRVVGIDAQPRCLDRLASAAVLSGFETRFASQQQITAADDDANDENVALTLLHTALGDDEQRSIRVGATRCSGLWSGTIESRWIDAESAFDVDVPMLTLEHALRRVAVGVDRSIDVMKIDIEGGEVCSFFLLVYSVVAIIDCKVFAATHTARCFETSSVIIVSSSTSGKRFC